MEKVASKIYLVLVFTLLIYFIYSAVTTTPLLIKESDSLAYHIPIASTLAKFNFLPPNLAQGLGYYPSSPELILALFILLHLPLNLFGVLGWILLFFISVKAARSFDLSQEMSIIFGGTIVTLQSVLRWPLTQTTDIWLTVFFLSSLYFLKKKHFSVKDYLLLGISLGFLIGAKYSGLLFSIPLLILFGGNIFKKVDLIKALSLLIPIFVFGFYWYVRNFYLTGNPLYPANFLFLKGNPDFPKTDYLSWTLAGNIISNPKFFLTFIESLNTEFLLLWTSIFYAAYLSVKKNLLSILGILIFLIFAFVLPYWKGIDVSNLRFIYPAIIVCILSIFIYFKKYFEELIGFCLLNSTFSLMNLSYRPKIIFIGLLTGFFVIFVKKWKYRFV